MADFVLISPYEIYITGRSAGTTNMIIWQEKGRPDIYQLEVVYDLSRLKRQLHEILPGETDLRVTAMQDSITLSGRVSSAADLAQALALARAYAPEGKVQNLVEVRGVQQVMLEVRVGQEMQRSLVRRLGVNFTGVSESGQNFGISKLSGLSEIVKPSDANIGSGGPLGIFVSPTVNAILQILLMKMQGSGYVFKYFNFYSFEKKLASWRVDLYF